MSNKEAGIDVFYLVDGDGSGLHRLTARELAHLHPDRLRSARVFRCPIAAALTQMARLQARGLVSPAPNAPELP